jgi:hypothetical protein
MSLRFLAYAALTALVAISLIFFSKPIAIWIVEAISPAAPSKGTPVAQISEVVGDVDLRQAHVTYTKPVAETPTQLYQHDAVIVRTGSLGRLIFQGGAEINVLEDSEVLVEFFNPKDALSPAYLTLRRGNLEIKKPGLAGRLFIVRDKKVISLAEWTDVATQPSNVVSVDNEAPAVSVNAASAGAAAVAGNGAATSAAAGAVKASGEALDGTAPIIDIGGGEQTLSSGYIESTLAAKGQQFRRCQINSVRDKLPALGQMLFSIRIESTGKIGAVKQLSSTINNIHLTSCVTDVIERSVFRAYNGKAITLSYPIDFQ